jgi:biopolymer transport protein TolR
VARKATARIQKPIGEINLTPLIDLTFLLLITFVITFPLIQSGIPVNLPRGKKAADLPTEHKRTITLDRQGALYVDDAPFTLDTFTAEMMELGRRDPDTTILLRADEAIAYGKVVDVLRILHEAKLARMALVTQPDRKSRP